MQAKVLTALLFLAVVALAGVALVQNRTIRDLRSQLASDPARNTTVAAEESRTVAVQATPVATSAAPSAGVSAPEPAVSSSSENESTSARRVMREFARMLENPQMNEVMQASQRATLEILYKDLLDAYQLSPDERKHFMDLLMARQMFRVDTSMKLMGGVNDPDEMKALADEMKEYDQVVKTEIETFLNDREDFGEFEFYEKTMQERMALSGFKAEVARAQTPLDDGVERQLIEIMAREKEAHTFRSDLADANNYNMDASRFSQANINAFEQDLVELHAAIAAEARALLTSDQLAALTNTLAQMRQMQISQLKMAANMFGGGTEPKG